MKAASNFISDFPPVSEQEWKARLQKDLKGVSFEELMITDRNGIAISPFYTGTYTVIDASPLYRDWFIMDEVKTGNESEANQRSLLLLNNGISGLIFEVNERTDFNVLLRGIALDYIHLYIKIKGDTTACIRSLNQYLDQESYKTGELNITIDSENAYDIWHHASGDTLHVKGEIYNNAGATAVFENSCILLQVNEGLHSLQENGSPEQLRKIYITTAADTYFFEQIAKIRALRNAIESLCTAYAIHPEIHITVNTSAIYLAKADKYNNLLRNTIAGMAAVIGGADSLFIRNFDSNTDNEFSSRMSRNQQLIFKDESYLHLVADQAGGAYFIEYYSHAIAERSWDVFRETEASGGWKANIESGYIADQIREQSRQLIDDYRSGKRLLIGVNKYPAAITADTTDTPVLLQWNIPSVNIEKGISG